MHENHINAPSAEYDNHIGEETRFEECDTCYQVFHLDELSNAVVRPASNNYKPIEKLCCEECKEWWK